MTTLIIFTAFLRGVKFLLNISLLQAGSEKTMANAERVSAGFHKTRKLRLTEFTAKAVW
jgi:hypothetical protein